jgi:hypothetical protein
MTLFTDFSFGAFGAMVASAITGEDVICFTIAAALTIAGFLINEKGA